MASKQIRVLYAVLETLLLLGHFSCLAESTLHTHFPNRGKTMLHLLPQGRKLLRTTALAPPAPVGGTMHRRDEPPEPPDDGEDEPPNLEPEPGPEPEPEPEPEPDEEDPPETSCDDEQEPEWGEGNPPDTSSEDTPWEEAPEPEPEADETPDSGDAGNMPAENLI